MAAFFMKGRSRILVLLAAGTLAAVFFILSGSLYNTKDSGGGSRCCRILSSAELEKLYEQNGQAPFSAGDLIWQGGAVACDEEAALVYLPCSLSFFKETAFKEDSGEAKARQSEWESLLSNLMCPEEGSALYIAEDEKMSDPAAAMREGYRFAALLMKKKGAVPFHIVVTGLPALCIEKTDSAKIKGKEKHSGSIRMIDCFSSDLAGVPEGSLSCVFHVRGNVSSTLAKKPYKIALTDGGKDKKKVSWLGLREDDDWILNPLYTDITRVREMTAYALWEETLAFCKHPQVSSRMRYVELFMDNRYCGLYGLMEPVDKKQLGLSEGDLLYKIDRWDHEDPYAELYGEKELAGETVIKNDKGFKCVEIRWPLSWDKTATWKPMEAFHRFTYKTQDRAVLEEAGLSADMDSIVSLSLFCGMVHAMDNNWKNTFLIAKKEAGGYSLYRTVWDLNYVFGDVFVFKPEEGYTAFDASTASLWSPGEDTTDDYDAFLSTDPSLREVMSEKWAQWRQGGISAEMVIDLAEKNRRLLEESGSLLREQERWQADGQGESGLVGQDSMDQMKKWIRERFGYLDDFFRLSS